jgi:hypothetical protein
MIFFEVVAGIFMLIGIVTTWKYSYKLGWYLADIYFSKRGK